MVVWPASNSCPMFESIGGPKGPNWKLRLVCAVVVLALVTVLVWLLRITQMPLHSFKGPLPPLSREQSDLADRLSGSEVPLNNHRRKKHPSGRIATRDK